MRRNYIQPSASKKALPVSLVKTKPALAKAPVAGIAMGLVKEGEKFAILTDILGDEDHLGDMDFKVAGTSKGVTALQMDIKIKGITEEIMEIALGQALEARLNILGQMNQIIGQSRNATPVFATSWGPRFAYSRPPL